MALKTNSGVGLQRGTGGPSLRSLASAAQTMYRILLFSGGGKGVVLGVTMASKDSGAGVVPIVFTRVCQAGSYVAVCGRSNAGVPSFTADGGLVLTQSNNTGLSEGIVPATGLYTFTSGSAAGVMVAGVIEIIKTGNSVAAGADNAIITTNPGTFTPAPPADSVAFAFMSDSNFVGLPVVTSQNTIVGLMQAGNASGGFESLVILAQNIPAAGAVFQANGVGITRGASRQII